MSERPTDLELETLTAVVETGSERVAAQRLGLTQHAVHKRISTLRRRLGVSTTAQAFGIALRAGWIDPPFLRTGTRSDR